MRYQDHFNWLEMSSGASGVGGGAAGALHGAQLCSGGGGCGAVLGYDGAFAALASATTAAPGLHSNGAARMRGDWLDTSHAESASSTRGNDSRLVDEATDTGSGWDRERPGKDGIEGSGAANGESDHLKKAGGINIDYRPSRSQLGGGRRGFMDAALRRVGYTRDELQLGDRRSGGECLSLEDDRVNKRRASSLNRAAKRVCLGRAEERVHCGIGGSKGAGAAWTCASLRRPPGDDRGSQEPVKNQRQAHVRHGLGERPHVSGRVQLGDPVKRTLLYRPAATGAGSADDISGTDGRTVGTAKGRVRLYTMPSFVAAAGANGVAHWAPGGVHHALSWVHRPAGDPELQDAGVQCRRFAGETGSERRVQRVAQEGILLPREQALVADEAALLCNGKCKRSGCATPTVKIECGRTARCRAVVEAGAGEARRRLARLEERTERLQRRLRVVQVKQVERHVAQQLQGLLGVASQQGEWGWTGSTPASSGELSRLAQSCSQALRRAEGGLDSDHTASSSGGESEVEETGEHWLPKTKLQDTPEWWWVQERAWLGSRWAWLQAQVSELEYRIRGLSDLYAHLRQSKGRGVHQPTDRLPPVEAPQVEGRHLLPTSSGLHSAAATCLNSGTKEPAASQLTSAARVRALPSWRRCRLVFPGNVTALAAKAVSVQCWCAPPLVCILCSKGLTLSPFVKDAPPRGRAAQLDLSLHPVLSLPSDVHLGLQSAALLRFVGHSHGAIRPIGRHHPPSRLAGQGSHRLNHPKRRAVCPQPRPLLHGTDSASDRAARGLGWSSHRLLPTDLHFHPPTPPASDTPSQPLRRRRGESSFDIDNLVMPLGSAGLGGGARVQRLQYKEILTPSWRELGSQGSLSLAESGLHPVPHDTAFGSTPVNDQEQDEEEEEDVSDAAFRSRHAQWECRERGRWGRGAHRRRRGRSLCRRGRKLPPAMELRPCHPPEWGSQWWEAPRGAWNIPVLEEDELVCDEQAVSPWERRSFPLSESELRRMREEEEDKEEGPSGPLEDLVATNARSHSTDSGISMGSLELSPVTPWPPHPPTNSGYPSPLHSTQGSGRGR